MMSKKTGWNEYHFSFGDSSEGPIGCCLTVVARDKDEAVVEANKLLEGLELEAKRYAVPDEDYERFGYVNVYFNNVLTVDDIDEVDENVKEPDRLSERVDPGGPMPSGELPQ